MMKEVLSLLNNSNPEHQGSEIILTTIIQWLQESPKTILLSPCIHAASRNLASLTYMVQIVEKCIHLSFVNGKFISDGVGQTKVYNVKICIGCIQLKIEMIFSSLLRINKN
jgi:hypothetical protein